MASTIQLKRSAQSGKVPDTGSLNLGELAINTYDGKIYFKKSGSVESVESVLTTNSTVTGSIRLEGTGSFGSLKVNDTLTINHGEAIISGSALVTSDLTILGAVNARQFNISVISSSVICKLLFLRLYCLINFFKPTIFTKLFFIYYLFQELYLINFVFDAFSVLIWPIGFIYCVYSYIDNIKYADFVQDFIMVLVPIYLSVILIRFAKETLFFMINNLVSWVLEVISNIGKLIKNLWLLNIVVKRKEDSKKPMQKINTSEL